MLADYPNQSFSLTGGPSRPIRPTSSADNRVSSCHTRFMPKLAEHAS